MSETGSVKFSCEHVHGDLAEFAGLTELNYYRTRLIQLGLIGVDPNGIGFGNLSIRSSEQGFYITGSGTGKLTDLTNAHYSRVTAFDFEKNWLRCEGSVVASSESLTHAAVYDSDPTAMAVIHGHDLKLWETLLNKVPATPKGVAYGTPAMAFAVQNLFGNTDVRDKKFFIMSGHEGGIVTFGKDLKTAFDILTRNRAA